MTKTPVRGNSNRFGEPVQMGTAIREVVITGNPVNRGTLVNCRGTAEGAGVAEQCCILDDAW